MNGNLVQLIAASNENVPDSAPTPIQNCTGGLGKYNEKFHLVALEDGRQLANVNYRVVTSTGETFEGKTDAYGFTERITTALPVKLKIEILNF